VEESAVAVEPERKTGQWNLKDMTSRTSPYDRWLASTGVIVHEGYFIPDVRTVKLTPWDERECDTAFLKLAGQEGYTEARVSEIPPGATLPAQKFAFDEAVYVVEGRGLTTLWSGDGQGKHSFEWQKHSLFIVPRYARHQFSNTQGNRPARLLHFNYLPLAMAANPEPAFFFNNPFEDPATWQGEHYSTAAQVGVDDGDLRGMSYWIGNFFPDMRAWDRLDPYRGRGAGGRAVFIAFPTSPLWAHMSVFPAQTYKKAHRHGPGVVIIIPSGEGFSVMWPEGKDKIFIPWQEGSVFVPPDRWFHQHFNVGAEPGRYLALHSPRHFNMSAEAIEDPSKDQIEYPEEDPWIRQTFEAELAKRGLSSLMPEEAYQKSAFEWTYSEDK
jgi:mannose-6-phosphate isomerase-like protein (cupin superfamily)